MGSIGLRHARLYAALPDTVVEICESRPAGLEEARRQSPMAKYWTDYAAALESGPDFVVVATPHQLHAEMSIAAMEKGIPVLSEKPMSDNLGAAEAMVAASRRTHQPLAVGYHLRFHPGVQRLRKMLAEGEVGPLVFARYCVDSLVALENSRSRYQATLPGALFMDYSHGLDLLLHLTGEIPKSVETRGVPGAIGELKADPILCSAILGYDQPLQVELHMSYVLKPEVHTLQVIGRRLGVTVELNSGQMEIHEIRENTLQRIAMPYERDPLYVRQWRAFRAHCAGQPSYLCTAEHALKTNQLMDRLLRAWGKA